MTSKQLSLLLVVAFAACDAASPVLPPDVDTTLEEHDLLSGREGTLFSEAFSAIELSPAQDSSHTWIPHRWSNFRVLVAGDTTDSWRVDARRIGFRVPIALAGETVIEVSGDNLRPGKLGARIIGAEQPFFNHVCMGSHVQGIQRGHAVFVPASSEELVVGAATCETPHGDWAWGFARIIPARGPMAMRWLPGFHFVLGQDSTFRTWAAGPSYRPGHMVVERPIPRELDLPSETWVVKLGFTPEPLEELACTPEAPEFSFTPAETAPGICLTLHRTSTHGDWQVRRNGELVFEMPRGQQEVWSPAFRVGPNGVAVVTDLTLSPDGRWPVFAADGHLIAAVSGYRSVSGAAFSAGGDTLFVLATPSAGDAFVLDARDSRDGTLLQRAPVAGNAERDPDLARSGPWLWVLLQIEKGWRVELRDPVDLSIRRWLVFPEAEAHDVYTAVARLGMAPVVLPDASGRRAYVVGHGSSTIASYLVSFF